MLDAARSLGMPVTTRGAGTSCAGNAVGPGLVVDVARHLNRIHEVDAEARLAVVEPGVVQASLQPAAAPYGLRFGPDPSTHTRCTIGGMIGNNACGPRALGFGKTADNVIALEVVTGSGERLTSTVARRWTWTPRPRCTPCSRWSRRPRHDPDRVRHLRSPGVGLQPGAPAAGAEVRRHPVPGRHRGHPGGDHRGDRPAGRRRAAQDHDRARLRVHARGRGRDSGPARLHPDRDRGAGPTHRRGGPSDPRRGRGAAAAPRRRLDVRRARRRRPGRAGGPGRGAAGRRPAAWTARWSPTRPRRSRCGRSARTAPVWPGSRLADPAYPGWEDAAVPPAKLGAYLRDFDALLDELRPARAAVRALRRRLRARADRLPADLRRRRRPVPLLRGGGGPVGGRLRRVDVGRARRRPGAVRAAAGHVLPRRHRAVRRGQGGLRPRQPAQPRGAGRPAARRRRSAGGRVGRTSGRPASPPRCTSARAWASAWPTAPAVSA